MVRSRDSTTRRAHHRGHRGTQEDRSEANYESEQILEVFQAARAWRREIPADFIVPDGLAEAVAKIDPANEPQINADMAAKDRAGGREVRGGKRRRTCRRDEMSAAAGQVCHAETGAEIRANSTASTPKVNQKAEDCGLLGTAAFLQIERAVRRGRRVQQQIVAIPDEIALQAEVVVDVSASE